MCSKVVLLLCLLVGVSFVFGELQTTISLNKDKLHLGFQELVVNWEIVNTDNSPALLLKHGTPLEGIFQNTLTTDMFEILNENGESPVYTGILMKRDVPKEHDFEIIRGKESISGQITLTNAYHFEVDGKYTIKLMTVGNTLLDLFPIISNEVVVEVEGARPIEYMIVPESLAVTFKSCSSSEQSTTTSAINNAISASKNALNYLNSGCRPVYETWFGSYSTSNYNTVDSHFTNIYSSLNSKNFGIDCSCNQAGTYAYVYPTDPTKTIYLCPVFWTSSSNAYTYNSQPGTLTHEMSHFNAVAGTNDYQYGVTGCKNLAQTNPSRAIMNADNHEYFQESGPSC